MFYCKLKNCVRWIIYTCKHKFIKLHKWGNILFQLFYFEAFWFWVWLDSAKEGAKEKRQVTCTLLSFIKFIILGMNPNFKRLIFFWFLKVNNYKCGNSCGLVLFLLKNKYLTLYHFLKGKTCWSQKNFFVKRTKPSIQRKVFCVNVMGFIWCFQESNNIRDLLSLNYVLVNSSRLLKYFSHKMDSTQRKFINKTFVSVEDLWRRKHWSANLFCLSSKRNQ